MRSEGRKLITLFGTVILASASWLSAQTASEVTQKLSENYKQLRQYSWTMRTEVLIQGQQQSVTVEKIRYNLDGNLQTSPLGGSGQLTPELQQAVDSAARVAFSYAQPEPTKFQAFLQKASMWEGLGANAGILRIEGEGFLQRGDFLDVRAQNQRAERLVAETLSQGTRVSVEADYRALPQEGPTFVARLWIGVPAKQIEITMENFDHVKNAPISAADISILPEGTELTIRLTQPLSSAKNKSGQSFDALLDEALVVHGRTVAAKGSRITGQLVEVEGSGKVSGRAKMSLKLTALTVGAKPLPIETNTLSVEAEGTKRRDARRIGGGAGVGALIGGIAGGGDGALKGAAIGAGIGTAATLLTKGKEVEFEVEALFSFKLSKPLKTTP